MKKHVLILGSGGMLGHVVNKHLRSLTDYFVVTDVARNSHSFKADVEMDLTDFTKLHKLYNREKPDIIINCVGILNNKAENNFADAILINSYLPHFLEQITSKDKCRVIHISTDCVFSGKVGNYVENDLMDSNENYGRSKALGEIRNDKDLTIRTSIIGPELHTNGVGLLQWFSYQKDVISGYSEVFWTGITTLELSKAIVHCIREELSGLYHLVNGEKISKYELLCLFKLFFSKALVTEIIICNNTKYDKSLINTRIDFSYRVPTYEVMIQEIKTWIVDNYELYPHYQSIV